MHCSHGRSQGGGGYGLPQSTLDKNKDLVRDCFLAGLLIKDLVRDSCIVITTLLFALATM